MLYNAMQNSLICTSLFVYLHYLVVKPVIFGVFVCDKRCQMLYNVQCHAMFSKFYKACCLPALFGCGMCYNHSTVYCTMKGVKCCKRYRDLSL